MKEQHHVNLEKIGINVFKERVIPKLYEQCLLYSSKERISNEILQNIDLITHIFEKMELYNIITILDLYKKEQDFDILDVFPKDPHQLMSALVKRYTDELEDQYITEAELSIQAINHAFKYTQAALTPYEFWYSSTGLSRIISSIIFLDMKSEESDIMCLTYILGGINTPEEFIEIYCRSFNEEE